MLIKSLGFGVHGYVMWTVMLRRNVLALTILLGNWF